MYMTSSKHSNLQVTITVTCLNFAVTGSRILLPALSSSRRVETVAKNHIEFQWGSKLQGTSSKALVLSYKLAIFLLHGIAIIVQS